MHILRWLMKHPLILAWVLALTAILLNFGLGGTANNGHKVAAGHQPAAAEQQPATATTAVVPAAAPAVAAEVAPAAVTAQVVAPAVAVEAAPAAAPAVQTAAEAPAAAPPAVAAEAAGANSEADLLRAAREAFWSNELDNAVGFYTSLLKQAPDSVEYKGELANVYWKQGNAQQAATLFADIAPQIAAQGRTTEALNMKLYVDMVDPELAKKIDAGMNK